MVGQRLMVALSLLEESLAICSELGKAQHHERRHGDRQPWQLGHHQNGNRTYY